MKKAGRIFSTILIISMLLCTLITTVTNAQSVVPNADKYRPGNETVPTNVTKMIGTIANAIQIIGIVLSAIILVMLGIKYVMGSAEEKADYKKSMIPFLIGAIFIATSGTIVKLIASLTQQAVDD